MHYRQWIGQQLLNYLGTPFELFFSLFVQISHENNIHFEYLIHEKPNLKIGIYRIISDPCQYCQLTIESLKIDARLNKNLFIGRNWTHHQIKIDQLKFFRFAGIDHIFNWLKNNGGDAPRNYCAHCANVYDI